MRKVYFNTMIKNEEDFIQAVAPIWLKYPVDKFVFYDDNSADKTVEVIRSLFPKERLEIINDNRAEFSESHNRSRMLEYSRQEKADFVLSIDSDELLSANFVRNFDSILDACSKNSLFIYWYNVVEESLSKIRQDNQYLNNYRNFILPLHKTGFFDLSQTRYHTPRTPFIDLPNAFTKEIGVIHLQSFNRKFYALKQLWYKTFEFVNYKYSEQEINNKYDPVVNNLDFQSCETPKQIIEGIDINLKFLDSLAVKKGYLKFILDNYNPKLITFGAEYVN
jgi:hypothetical protein